MMKYPEHRGFAVHPTTHVCSTRIKKGLSLFDEDAYLEGKLQPGHNIKPSTLSNISEFVGCELTAEELLCYCVSAFHCPHLRRVEEHRYYLLTLHDSIFTTLYNGAFIKSAGEKSKPLVEYYFLKYKERAHSDFYLDLHDMRNEWVMVSLMPGFLIWLSGCVMGDKENSSDNFLTWWYGGTSINFWCLVKPTLRENRVPFEPEHEFIYDEEKYRALETKPNWGIPQ